MCLYGSEKEVCLKVTEPLVGGCVDENMDHKILDILMYLYPDFLTTMRVVRRGWREAEDTGTICLCLFINLITIMFIDFIFILTI